MTYDIYFSAYIAINFFLFYAYIFKFYTSVVYECKFKFNNFVNILIGIVRKAYAYVMVYSIFLYLECVFLSLYTTRNHSVYIYIFAQHIVRTRTVYFQAPHTYVTYYINNLYSLRRDATHLNRTHLFIYSKGKSSRAQ